MKYLRTTEARDRATVRRNMKFPGLAERIIAVRHLNEENYELALDICTMLGGAAAKCGTPERLEVLKAVWHMAAYSQAQRAKVWRDAFPVG